jgi:hypothetical protein
MANRNAKATTKIRMTSRCVAARIMKETAMTAAFGTDLLR